jgi:predicted dehydrogenase
MAQNRRGFLKSAGTAAFTTSLFTGDIRGANDKVNIAFVGMGRMGLSNLGFAAKTPGVNVAAICDVSRPALKRAVAQARDLGFRRVKPVKDFREILMDQSVDAVCIATPDHWHAYMTVEACKAGKDVWVETPACVYVDEGVKMVQSARKYRRVVQAGSIQRSGGFFRKARAIVKSGDLGDVTFCRAFQAGVAGGVTTDWGLHLIDIVQFVFDEAMPLSLTAEGGKFYATDNRQTPDTLQATYRYSGFTVSYERLYNGDSGVTFHGTKANLMVSRAGYWLYPNDKNTKPVEESSKELADMNMTHWTNFLQCIRSRRKPTSDIETCVRSTTTCLLANLAYRHSTALDWDDGSFTVRQSEIQPFLKAKDRPPSRLEI